jgi:hypothetical protein
MITKARTLNEFVETHKLPRKPALAVFKSRQPKYYYLGWLYGKLMSPAAEEPEQFKRRLEAELVGKELAEEMTVRFLP